MLTVMLGNDSTAMEPESQTLPQKSPWETYGEQICGFLENTILYGVFYPFFLENHGFMVKIPGKQETFD